MTDQVWKLITDILTAHLIHCTWVCAGTLPVFMLTGMLGATCVSRPNRLTVIPSNCMLGSRQLALTMSHTDTGDVNAIWSAQLYGLVV